MIDFENILKQAWKLLSEYPLCDRCLGRMFSKLGFEMSNAERGRVLKTALFMKIVRQDKLTSQDMDVILRLAETGFKPALSYLAKQGLNVRVKPCYICRNLLNMIGSLKIKVLRRLREYKFKTYVVGTIMPEDVLSREESIIIKFNLCYAESIKREVNREIGKMVMDIFNANVDFQKPDIIITVDFKRMDVSILSTPIFIKGYYRKLKPYMPQSTWICRKCGGLGCEYCNYTGRRRGPSIEELLATIAIKFFQGEEVILHASGREDIDVRTLGRGRPFIIEIKHPRNRDVDLLKLAEEVNRSFRGIIEIHGLEYTHRMEVERLKHTAEKRRKTYRAIISLGKAIFNEEIAKLEKHFENRLIRQRTPLRVLARRPNIVREKLVQKIRTRKIGDNILEALIIAQGGLYIKELVSGDRGRTTPSFASILGYKAKCKYLEVLHVEG